MDGASDASDTVTRRLLDLHEDLLTNCAAQAADAPTLCRLSCSCKVFERVVPITQAVSVGPQFFQPGKFAWSDPPGGAAREPSGGV